MLFSKIIVVNGDIATKKIGTDPSLVTSPRAPPGEKRSGEPSRISWAYYPKAVRTNEIARSVRPLQIRL